MQAALEANGVHFFVQGGGFGSLFPGPQIGSWNARGIMVPDAEAALAKDALAPLLQPDPESDARRLGARSKLRIVCEVLLFGWFIPGKRPRRRAQPNDDRD